MGRIFRRPRGTTLCALPLLLAAAGLARADVQQCRDLIGVNTAVNPPTIATSPPPTAWNTVDAYGASFTGNRMIDNCSVKAVVTSVKRKPTTTTLDLGPMTQGECTMYNYLSSIDSKLVQSKIAEAYATVTDMVAKIDGLGGSAKLIDPGYSAIRGAAVGVQTCIAPLQ